MVIKHRGASPKLNSRSALHLLNSETSGPGALASPCFAREEGRARALKLPRARSETRRDTMGTRLAGNPTVGDTNGLADNKHIVPFLACTFQRGGRPPSHFCERGCQTSPKAGKCVVTSRANPLNAAPVLLCGIIAPASRQQEEGRLLAHAAIEYRSHVNSETTGMAEHKNLWEWQWHHKLYSCVLSTSLQKSIARFGANRHATSDNAIVCWAPLPTSSEERDLE